MSLAGCCCTCSKARQVATAILSYNTLPPTIHPHAIPVVTCQRVHKVCALGRVERVEARAQPDAPLDQQRRPREIDGESTQRDSRQCTADAREAAGEDGGRETHLKDGR